MELSPENALGTGGPPGSGEAGGGVGWSLIQERGGSDCQREAFPAGRTPR